MGGNSHGYMPIFYCALCLEAISKNNKANESDIFCKDCYKIYRRILNEIREPYSPRPLEPHIPTRADLSLLSCLSPIEFDYMMSPHVSFDLSKWLARGMSALTQNYLHNILYESALGWPGFANRQEAEEYLTFMPPTHKIIPIRHTGRIVVYIVGLYPHSI